MLFLFLLVALVVVLLNMVGGLGRVCSIRVGLEKKINITQQKNTGPRDVHRYKVAMLNTNTHVTYVQSNDARIDATIAVFANKLPIK
jgi:hypothetical protein